MLIVGETPCPDDVVASLCVLVEISNRGETPDVGTCRLRGQRAAPGGGEETVYGPTVDVPYLAPGDSVQRVLPWDEDEPDHFLGECEPTLAT